MIGLDARLQSYRAGGISEHIARLVEGYREIGQDRDITVLRHAKPPLTADYGPRGLASRTLITPPHHRLENVLVPLELLPARLDMLHSPDTVLPRWWLGRGVITVHDVAFLRRPELVTDESRRYYGQIHRSVQQAKRIIVVSDYTRRELLALTDADADRVRVVPNALHPRYRPASDPDADTAAAARYGLTGPFILFVSTIEPRKNIGVLLQAFRLLLDRDLSLSEDPGPALVLVGADGWHSADVYGTAAELGLLVQDDDLGSGRARFLDYVPYDDLVSLYRCATVVAHPALDEGFGLTVLEAMACGAPVVVADAGSLPEVAGEAALRVLPHDPAAWADALARLLADAALRTELGAVGLIQARGFTAARMAKATRDVYAETLA